MVFLGLLLLLGTVALGETRLALYSSGLALVEETRRFSLSPEGVLELRGFPAETQWETLRVEGVEAVSLQPAEAQTLLRYRAPAPGEKDLRFVYLTWGLGWKITYDAELLGERLEVLGKAVVENHTGVDFSRVKMTLVAGEVRPPAALATKAVAPLPEGAPKEAFEYHRYDLPGLWDLPQGKTIFFLVRTSFPATRFYRFWEERVEVGVRFSPQDQILPAGEMRIYADGIWIGAGNIPHLPVGKSTELLLGTAFDLWGERREVSKEKIEENLYRSTRRITLRSQKAEEAVVEVIEDLPGYWRILSFTLPPEPVDSQRVKFVVPVPAGGESTVEYTVEWRY